jgi:cyclase
VAEAVNIPVIASGGAGNIDHIYDALTEGKAEAALVASIVHYGKYSIRQIKEELRTRGIEVRV